MTKKRLILIFLNLTALLLYVNYSIIKNEQIIDEGKLIYLELAPRDPRSLMQGDYMVLRYKIAIDVKNADSSGYCVVTTDEKSIAKRVRLQKSTTPLNSGETVLKYRKGRRGIKIGAESFFFEEGRSRDFSAARYGGVRVDRSGTVILTDLYDKNLKKL